MIRRGGWILYAWINIFILIIIVKSFLAMHGDCGYLTDAGCQVPGTSEVPGTSVDAVGLHLGGGDQLKKPLTISAAAMR
jgi:hypothetical protein